MKSKGRWVWPILESAEANRCNLFQRRLKATCAWHSVRYGPSALWPAPLISTADPPTEDLPIPKSSCAKESWGED